MAGFGYASDEVSLSIIALVVSSMAIFAGLLQAGGPKLARSFYGDNPFAIKAAAINYYIERIFVAVGLAGVLLQMGVYVFSDRLPDRNYSSEHYVVVFLGAFLSMLGVLGLARGLAALHAKKTWHPQVYEHQAAIFRDVVFASEHEGVLSNYLPDVPLSPERQEINDQRVDSSIEQLEDLFLGKRRKGSLQERVARLKKVFPD